MRIYAVGDVHGCRDQLSDVFARIDIDLATRPCSDYRIVLLGDYVDRGPDSPGVLDDLIARRKWDHKLICLCGNHDKCFSEFLVGHRTSGANEWLRWGGVETLAAYWVPAQKHIVPGDKEYARLRQAALAAVPQLHREFLAALPNSIQLGGYFFVHAGIRPDVPLDEQNPVDLLWIRGPFLDSAADHGAVIVHGHTPCPEGVDVQLNRIGIDTMAYETGVLTCLVLEEHARWTLEKDGPRTL